MPDAEYPIVRAASDASLLIEFGDGIDEAVNDAVFAFDTLLQTSDVRDLILETVPAYRTLLIEYDPIRVGDAEFRARVGALLDDWGAAGAVIPHDERELVEIPVVYGGEHGPDLSSVAEHAGLSPDDVVTIHAGATYRVYMIGFAPGFPYLGGMDPRIACPRLTEPRVRIRAGSVGIAESQTGIYPDESAGGWRIIGRSPTRLFDVERNPPSLLDHGASVKFVAVESADWQVPSSSEQAA